jgi:hypothetical protein
MPMGAGSEHTRRSDEILWRLFLGSGEGRDASSKRCSVLLLFAELHVLGTTKMICIRAIKPQIGSIHETAPAAARCLFSVTTDWFGHGMWAALRGTRCNMKQKCLVVRILISVCVCY